MSRSLHDARGVERHQEDLAAVLLAEGRLDEADRTFQETLAAHRKAGEEDAAAQTRMSLALVREEQGRPAEALALARQSSQSFTAMRQSGNTALALAIGALAEVALHQTAAAEADCEKARATLQGNHQNQPNLFVLLAQARVETAAGHLAKARGPRRGRAREGGKGARPGFGPGGSARAGGDRPEGARAGGGGGEAVTGAGPGGAGEGVFADRSEGGEGGCLVLKKMLQESRMGLDPFNRLLGGSGDA